MTPTFDDTELLLRRALDSVSEPGTYFSSDEYLALRSQAAQAFQRIGTSLELFFDVVRGLADGSCLGYPNIGGVLSFPRRHLHSRSIDDIPAASRRDLDASFKDTFYLGLLSHFVLRTFPTRGEMDRVQVDALLSKWFPSSLVADQMMKQYSIDINNLPERIYLWHFANYVQPTLRKHFGFGFWRLGKARSFFRNLYFGGARLGMEFDLMTRTSA